jgi:hypothetical protein
MLIPEQTLWCSVITRAVHDAFLTDERHWQSAWRWFYRNSGNYRFVCTLANVNSEQLRKNLIETIFFTNLINKGEIKMTNSELNNLDFKKGTNNLEKVFETARRAKAIFCAIYSQQELNKAIGSLSLRDIFNICEKAEAILESNND